MDGEVHDADLTPVVQRNTLVHVVLEGKASAVR
jgi:hypothetical protein